MHYIPYGRQSISNDDIQAVIDALKADWLTQGPTIARFEKAITEYCGVRYATATCNATAALHIACLALGLGKGDVLWTTPNTFVASANCALYCGAKVDFVDIDMRTYNMSVEKLEEKLIAAEKRNALPKVIIPVDFAGQSCDMVKIKSLADKYGFKIIEDASHAIGGSYKGKKIGSCQYSDITVFSFHPVKIITTGEGGVALTNQRDLHDKLQILRTHGITRDENLMKNVSHGPWYYEQVALGVNYRMTDIQAALGISQLQRLDEFVTRRRELVANYNNALSNLPVQLPIQNKDCRSAWHLYVICLRLEKLNQNRKQIFEKLRKANIGVNVHYIPLYQQPYYQKMGFGKDYCSNAEKYYASAISLPLYAGLTHEEQEYVITKMYETVQ
jgi:UDP-4-amino-4,6-dideoxy-N-acetyl-beta-L-altrosamine transaminase